MKLQLETNSSDLLIVNLENLFSEKKLSILHYKQEEDLSLHINELKEKKNQCHLDYELNMKGLNEHCEILEKMEELKVKDITETDLIKK